MKDWFRDFAFSLQGSSCGPDLIGAGTATAQMAIEHYQFQHKTKILEVLESTFPEIKRVLGDDWILVWNDFWQTKPSSPRSLDFYPDVFLDYLTKSQLANHIKELARFERYLDTYPWSHVPLSFIRPAEISEDSRLVLGEYNIRHFSAPVVSLFQEIADLNLSSKESSVIWLNEKGVQYKKILPWEIQVLQNLQTGVGNALEYAPEDGQIVGSFFKWLGQSGLIQSVLLPE